VDDLHMLGQKKPDGRQDVLVVVDDQDATRFI
jgi:hypothetical protein